MAEARDNVDVGGMEKKEEEKEDGSSGSEKGLRENLIASAVVFLSNPKVVNADESKKRDFLRGKGLSDEEIAEAERRVKSASADHVRPPPPSAPQTATTSPRKPWDAANNTYAANGNSASTMNILGRGSDSQKMFTPYRLTQLAALLGAAVGIAYYCKDFFWPSNGSSHSGAKNTKDDTTSDIHDEEEGQTLQRYSTSASTPASTSTAPIASLNNTPTTMTALESQVSSLALQIEKLQDSFQEVVSTNLKEKVERENSNIEQSHVLKDEISDKDKEVNSPNSSLDLAQELRQLRELLSRGSQSGTSWSGGEENTSNNGNNKDAMRNYEAEEEMGSSMPVRSYNKSPLGEPELMSTSVSNNESKEKFPQNKTAVFTNNGNVGLSPGLSEFASPQLMSEKSIASATSRSFVSDINENGISNDTPSVMSSVKVLSRPATGDKDYQKFLQTVDPPAVNPATTTTTTAPITSSTSKGKEPMQDNSSKGKTSTRRSMKDPPHPQSYLEVMQALQEGKPIPGIKHIDDSPPNPKQPFPETDESTPRKPWLYSNNNISSGNDSGKDNGADDGRLPSWMII